MLSFALLLLFLVAVSGQKYNADQVTKAASAAGFQPPPQNVQAMVNAMNEKSWAPGEQAMMLAHAFHETAGLKFVEEIACAGSSKCTANYPSKQGGLPGKSYHGRGFLQLTWDYNYKAASQGLGLGDQLLKDPERVSKDLSLAGKTAVWFWKNKVWNQGDVAKLRFGSATRAINGNIECSKGKTPQATARWGIYLKISGALNAQPKASEGGCYN